MMNAGNNFSQLDAQDEISRLSQIRCDEQIVEMQQRKKDEKTVRDNRKVIAKLNELELQPWHA
jgi:hypothetical protein